MTLIKLVLSTLFTIAVFNNCAAQSQDSKISRRLLLRDEGLSQLSYIDLANHDADWFVKVPAGRDMQLVGNGRVLIGTGNGYEEYEIKSGNKVGELNSFPGTVTARRLKNGNSLLAGIDWQDKKGIVLLELDKRGKIIRQVNFPGYNYVRLIRETLQGNFLVTADDRVFEGNAKGEIRWQATVKGLPKPHAWQALRLKSGQTMVSSGYAKNLQVFEKDGRLSDSISGPDEVHPHFYAGFQILANGNYVVTNWQGHGPAFGASGIQLLEYTAKGKLAWSWKQDAAKFSSLQAVIVLDGLDLNKLNVEDASGKLAAVK